MPSFHVMLFVIAVFVFKSLNRASRSRSMKSESGFSWEYLNRVQTVDKEVVHS